MDYAVAIMIVCFTLHSAAIYAASPVDPGEQYLRKAARPGVSPLEKTAYEELARIQFGNFNIEGGMAPTGPLPYFRQTWEKAEGAIFVLYRMGLEVLPVLVEALDDTTPTKTVTYPKRVIVPAGEPQERRIWKVGELVAVLIYRIADREFVIRQGNEEGALSIIGKYPDLVPEFKKAVLDWHKENGKKPLAERKIRDLRDDYLDNRVHAIEWIGEHKENSAQQALLDHVDRSLASKNTGTGMDWELSRAAKALGQLGDPATLEQVRRICKHLSSRQRAYSAVKMEGLYDAYRGLALLGEKDEALRGLTQVYESCYASNPEVSDSNKKDFLELLEKAKDW